MTLDTNFQKFNNMTLKEWISIKQGSIVSNTKGSNHRIVLEASYHGIRLPSKESRNKEYTYITVGDKNKFKLVKE